MAISKSVASRQAAELMAKKGKPFISVMRNDVAVLGTAGLAYMKTAFLELPLLKFKFRQKIMAFYKILHVFIDIVIFCLLNILGITMPNRKHGYRNYHEGMQYCNINFGSTNALTLTFSDTTHPPEKGKQPLS